MKVIDRTKAVTQHFLENSFKKLSIKKKIKKKNPKNTNIYSLSKCLLCHDVVRVLCRSLCQFCTGHFVMVPLNMTYLHCLKYSLFEHLFNLYYYCGSFYIQSVNIIYTGNKAINHWRASRIIYFIEEGWRSRECKTCDYLELLHKDTYTKHFQDSCYFGGLIVLSRCTICNSMYLKFVSNIVSKFMTLSCQI